MYHTILVPLENSWADETILAHVTKLAKSMNSRLILVHVADGMVARNQDQLNLSESQEMRADRAYLESRRDELAAAGLDVTVQLACGEPAEEILNIADRENCDLIAMSTHGHRFIKDFLLGSVANVVRHRTQIPVLLVRAARSDGSTPLS
ncbi:MAG: universal stress protein [Planctomycetes bacterium]|nr:universal stress protein [Planctomycetota bacterium]MBI3835164.1 universal stress protein [Planctomycetota bacterium]